MKPLSALPLQTARRFMPLLAALLALVFARFPAAHASDTLHVELTVVRASHGEPKLDPALHNLRADLSTLPYHVFSRVGGAQADLKPGTPQSLQLNSTVRAQITLTSLEATGSTLQVTLFRNGEALDTTTISRPFGKTQMLSVGRNAEAAWIVALRASR